MSAIRSSIKLVPLPLALTSVYACIYYVYSREALGYGCHHSLFNPYILGYSINHKDAQHITFNTIALWFFSLYTIHTYGNVVTAIVYISSVIAAAASYYIQCYVQRSNEEIIGASGGVYGLIGLTLVIAIINLVKRSESIENQDISLRVSLLHVMFEVSQLFNVSIVVALDLAIFLTNKNSDTAHSAHLGGFICGFVLGCLVAIGHARVT